MGLATARALTGAGHDVVVLEQFELGHARGSSHGTSRIFRLSYPEAEWVRLAEEALPLWRELEAESGETLLQLNGSIDLGDWHPNRSALEACAVEYVVLDRYTAERGFGLVLTPGEEALLQPEGGIVLADKALAAFAGAFSNRGGRLLEETPVTSVTENGAGVRIEHGSGSLEVQAAVVTAGAWAPRLVDLPEAVTTRETTAYFDHEGPLPSLIDSTLEGGIHGYALAAPGYGTKAGIHKSGRPTNPDGAAMPDYDVADAAGEWLARRFPGFPPNHVRVETCLYTNLPDERFTCERRGRIVVGSACSGHGFKFAPVIGKQLAALAVEAVA